MIKEYSQKLIIMKKTGCCPKCSSNNIFTNKSFNNFDGDRYRIAGGSSFSFLYIEAYACFDCGFIEENITKESLQDEGKIEKMKKKWLALKK